MQKYAAGSAKGQIEVTFNWIYIMAAGVVILLFFVGIVVRQKAVSEQQLAGDVLRVLESIFVGAGVSEKTKNAVDISSVSSYMFHLDCQDAVSELRVKQEYRENALDPLFGPAELQGRQLNVWSLPYGMPFKVMDFLLITTDTMKYYLLGSNEFAEEFLEEAGGEGKFRINVEHFPGLAEYSAVQAGKRTVRLIDVANTIKEDDPVPAGLMEADATAVVFTAANVVDYYEREGRAWRKLNHAPVQIVSLGGERDAVKYAAVFSADGENYQCNMQKAFKRLALLNEIYAGAEIVAGREGGKLHEMAEYYELRPHLSLTQGCINILKTNPDNMLQAMQRHQNAVKTCLLQPRSCVELVVTANAVQELNRQLLQEDCLTLY